MKKDASIALSYSQKRTACRVRSYERLKFGNSIMGWTDQVVSAQDRAGLRTICTDLFRWPQVFLSVMPSVWPIR